MMESRELERKDAPVPLGNKLIVLKLYNYLSPPDHLSRHDLSIDESLGESSYQQVVQLIFYLTLVSFQVRTDGPNAQTDLEFWSLLPSFLLSTLSLSLGQNKVLFNQPEHYNSFMNIKKITLFQTRTIIFPLALLYSTSVTFLGSHHTCWLFFLIGSEVSLHIGMLRCVWSL